MIESTDLRVCDVLQSMLLASDCVLLLRALQSRHADYESSAQAGRGA